MGNISDTLATVEGIQWYYIVGVILFLVLFFGVVIHTWLIPKKDLLQFKSSIFEKDEINN